MKGWMIVGALLIVMGITVFTVAMASNDWNFKNLSTVKYETNEHEISESFSDISIDTDTSDVILLPSEDGECRVVCVEEEKIKHTVSVENGILTIKAVNERKWYDNIGIGFGTTSITVYLPENEYESLVIKEDTGDVIMSDEFSFNSVDIKTSTGDVSITAYVNGEMRIETSTGDINVKKSTVDSIFLNVTTGDVTVSDTACEGEMSVKVETGRTLLSGVLCKKLSSKGTTGDVTLRGVISESITVKRSTGDVKFEGSDADEIYVTTSTGDIKGSILTAKSFDADSNTGKVRVPSGMTGGKCVLETDTGDIIIEIKK